MPLQHRPSRRDLAVGNIVDLRPYGSQDLSEVFGLFLGFSHVTLRREDLRDFHRILQSVSGQNRLRRRDGLAQASLAWMIAATVASRFRKPADIYRVYRKEIPLIAGLSNVNLEDSWPQRLHPTPLLRYLRVSPTGPMAPLVLNATTLRSRMQLALTYRASVLTSDAVVSLLRTITDLLEDFVR